MQHIGIFLIFAASVKSAGVYTSVKLYSLWKNFFARKFYSTDYLFSGSLTLKNGRIDMFQFDEGYCQATQYNATQDNFTFTMVCFLLKLHLYV